MNVVKINRISDRVIVLVIIFGKKLIIVRGMWKIDEFKEEVL